MKKLNSNKVPLLIDLDGVLRIGREPAEGVETFFEYLKQSERPACILSNSTLSNSKIIKKFFIEHSINCPFPVMTAADAAFNYIKDRYRKVAVYCTEPVKSMFNELSVDKNPEAVVIGDIGKQWNYEIILDIFKIVRAGADLIAMHKNKFWKTPEEGIILDAGPFIKAIEYATSKEAILIGKPSPLYFQMALCQLGYGKDHKFIMLGDDIETDIKGAQELGCKAILIYTGKTEYPLREDSIIKPDFETGNLKQAIELLMKLK